MTGNQQTRQDISSYNSQCHTLKFDGWYNYVVVICIKVIVIITDTEQEFDKHTQLTVMIGNQQTRQDI